MHGHAKLSFLARHAIVSALHALQRTLLMSTTVCCSAICRCRRALQFPQDVVQKTVDTVSMTGLRHAIAPEKRLRDDTRNLRISKKFLDREQLLQHRVVNVKRGAAVCGVPECRGTRMR